MKPTPSDLLQQAARIPLEEVLSRSGDPALESLPTEGGIRYQGERLDLILGGAGLWFDNIVGVGGRGPVDLALHLVQKVDPRRASPEQRFQAAEWVLDGQASSLSRNDTAAEDFQAEAGVLAIRDDDRWPMVRRHLIDACRIPPTQVDILRDDVYASYAAEQPALTDICFVRRNLAGQPFGATLVSLVAPYDTPRLIGSPDAWFQVGDQKGTRMVVTESPFDAVAFLVLNRPPDATIFAAPWDEMPIDEADKPPREVPLPLLQAAHDAQRQVIVALGNGPAAGEAYERCVISWHTRFGVDNSPHRIAPLGRTWSDDLREAKTLSRDHSW